MFWAGTLTISDSAVYGNVATDPAQGPPTVPFPPTGLGGGVFTYGDLTIDNTTITDNSAREGGGVFCHGYPWSGDFGSTTVLVSCTVSGNTGADAGADIMNPMGRSVKLLLTNSIRRPISKGVAIRAAVST